MSLNILKMITTLIYLISFTTLGLGKEANKSGVFDLSLDDETQLTIDGPHRFIRISGSKGFQPTSIHTAAYVETNIHQKDQGTISFWVTPLEDLAYFPNGGIYPLISDTYPHNDVDNAAFAIFWNSGYPQLVAKFTQGALWGQKGKLDMGYPPFVYAEKLTLRKGSWYLVAVTWDKKQKQIRLYVNGVLMGFHNDATGFENAGDKIYIGNPMMVIRDLKIEDVVESAHEVKDIYFKANPMYNSMVEEDIKKTVDLVELPGLNITRDSTWGKVYSCSFLNKNDLDGWIFQTGDEFRDSFDVRITDEGLFIDTPDTVLKESRMYLWSPKSFEGDQWIEFEFRLESPKGLALLVVCARGDQREDFINDHELKKTGSMGIILGDIQNYHWEFMRRVEIMRADVETQYLLKNPWHRCLHYGCIPRLTQDRWYRLRFVKVGNRLYGSIDGRTIFDVRDNAFDNNGPVLGFGRIGLRQMYQTTMRYRNFVVYNKKYSISEN